MDFSDLDDVLDEGGYVPTFGKPSKPTPPKTLLKNNSTKSIDSLGLPPPPQSRTNLMQLHKDTRNQVTTFEALLKQEQKPSPPKPPSLPKTYNDPPSRSQRSSSPAKADKRDDLNINSLLDDDDDAVGSRRGMRPPLARKNNDGRSMASRRNDDGRSVTSFMEIRKEEEKEAPPGVAPVVVSKPLGGEVGSGEWKKVLEEQLQSQREVSNRILKEEQALHKKEVERLDKMHQEELKRKLELKDLELANIRENYQLQLKSLRQSFSKETQLESVADRLAKGLQALERAELQLKNQSQQLTSEQQHKEEMGKYVQQQALEKENSLKQMAERLEAREREFREERLRALGEIDRERLKNQEVEGRLLRKERELEEAFNKKERHLFEELEQKQHKLTQDEAALRIASTDLEHQKQRFYQEREDALLKTKRWEEARIKALEEEQLEKAKLLAREAELSSREQEWENKTGELQFREKQLEGKLKLVQAERRKMQTQREVGFRTDGFATRNSRVTGLPSRSFQDVVPSGLQKSLKQLKDEYLRNLGHI